MNQNFVMNVLILGIVSNACFLNNASLPVIYYFVITCEIQIVVFFAPMAGMCRTRF